MYEANESYEPLPPAIYLIESGRPLEMVKEYVKQRGVVMRSRAAMCKELGTDRASWDRIHGALSGVVFNRGKEHPDFRKADAKGVSRPRKGSAWAQRFKDQPRHVNQAQWIADELGIPTTIMTRDRVTAEFRSGRHIGNMLAECGFLYMSDPELYGLWIPDVEAHLVRIKASREFDPDKEVIDEKSSSFTMQIPGCRRIFKEEWDIMILQAELQRKKAA